MKGVSLPLFLVILVSAFFWSTTFNGDSPLHAECCESAYTSACSDPATAAVSDYGDCLCCRSTLTGDWCGYRTCLATHGVTFQGDVTQYYQGVTTGGLQQEFEYGGHADYVFNMDLSKLGAWQGFFLKLRGESQFGTFANRNTGAILAANNEGLLPTPGAQETALTNVLFTQALIAQARQQSASGQS